MSAGGHLRRAVRASGVLACLGTGLFLVLGAVYLGQVDTPPRLWDRTWSAGEQIVLEDGPEVILWTPDPVAAQDVTCTLSGARSYDGPLPAGPDASRDNLATVTVDGRELTYLARVDHIRSGTVVCDGAGLRQVILSDDLRPGLERGTAVALFVGAGVTALWAAVTLRATRPRAGHA